MQQFNVSPTQYPASPTFPPGEPPPIIPPYIIQIIMMVMIFTMVTGIGRMVTKEG